MLLHISFSVELIWERFSLFFWLFRIKSFVLLLFIWVKWLSLSPFLLGIILTIGCKLDDWDGFSWEVRVLL